MDPKVLWFCCSQFVLFCFIILAIVYIPYQKQNIRDVYFYQKGMCESMLLICLVHVSLYLLLHLLQICEQCVSFYLYSESVFLKIPFQYDIIHHISCLLFQISIKKTIYQKQHLCIGLCAFIEYWPVMALCRLRFTNYLQGCHGDEAVSSLLLCSLWCVKNELVNSPVW